MISKSFILIQDHLKSFQKSGSYRGLTREFKMAAKRLPYSKLCDATELKSK